MATATEARADAAVRGGLRVDIATVAIGAIIVVTTFAKVTLYARLPLGVDEVWTGMVAEQRSIAALMRQTGLDVYAPLSYVVSWIWAQFSGLSNGALRAPSTLFACLAPLVALAPNKLGHRSLSFTWAALLACWMPGLFFAQDARCYALVFLLATLNTVAFVRVLRQPTMGRALAWMSLSSLAILDHYFAALIVACQGLAYIAIHRARALRTWPAVVVLAPACASIGFKALMLDSYAQPGISWIAPLSIGSLPGLVNFLFGGGAVTIGVAIWALAGLILKWRLPRRELVAAEYDPGQAALVAALAPVAAAALCIGVGFLRPIVTPRYLTAMAPGVLLGLALLAQRFARSWRLSPALLVTGFFGMSIGLLLRPPPTDSAFSFQRASEALMADHVRNLEFLWDNPLARTAIKAQFPEVGGFFFKRAGKPVPVDAPRWVPGSDPNRLLLSRAQSPGTGIIWIYDRNVAGTLATTHPPEITRIDPDWICQDFGGGAIGVITCHRRAAT
jgi:hypothetical protein